MPDLVEELSGLRPVERARLEHFAQAFERIDASEYATFSDAGRAEAAAAEANASRLIGHGPRRAAVKAVIRAFTDRVSRAYSERLTVQSLFLGSTGLPDRPDDRIRLLASVERVVVALVLWDELDEDDRSVLVGPWLALVDPTA
jgi:hypothetical protein